MKFKRFLLAAVCILSLPMWFSPSHGAKLNNSAPFATVAVAGHVLSGNAYCACGTPACVCDPGESATTSNSSQSPTTASDGTAQSDNGVDTGVDPGAGVMLLTLALLFGLRLRF